MSSTEQLQVRPIRRRLFGYNRAEVDERFEAMRRALTAAQEELDEVRAAADTTGALGHHLAGMLTRFADAVTAGEEEATQRAAAIVADAEARAAHIEAQARELLQQGRDLAAATYAEAGRRYEAAIAARQTASDRIESAIESMADALMSIKAMPDLPELVLPVPTVDPTTNDVSFNVPARAPQADADIRATPAAEHAEDTASVLADLMAELG